MAKDLVFLCDMCQEPALYVSLDLSVGQERPLQYLDLCAKHYAKLVQPLVDAFVKHGTAPNEPQLTRDHRVDRTTGPFLCQVQGCQSTPLQHRGSMWQPCGCGMT